MEILIWLFKKDGVYIMNNKRSDFLVIGFALFSMFLGAGNLIFPPLLGRNLGADY